MVLSTQTNFLQKLNKSCQLDMISV